MSKKNKTDPTKNVLDLVKAAIRRIDDLRVSEGDKIMALMSAESRRIDALLSRYESSQTLASERIATTANTLANSVKITADTLQQQTAAVRDVLEKRIVALEQRQYQPGNNEVINTVLENRISVLEQSNLLMQGRDSQKTDTSKSIQWSLVVILGAVGGFINLSALIILHLWH
jgi:hypothetical protein